jgi:hypothetical protein
MISCMDHKSQLLFLLKLRNPVGDPVQYIKRSCSTKQPACALLLFAFSKFSSLSCLLFFIYDTCATIQDTNFNQLL